MSLNAKQTLNKMNYFKSNNSKKDSNGRKNSLKKRKKQVAQQYPNL